MSGWRIDRTLPHPIMNVLCPSCGTGYEIPETQLRRPRKLRCANCASEWRVPAMITELPEDPPHPAAPVDRAGGPAEDPGPAASFHELGGIGDVAAPLARLVPAPSPASPPVRPRRDDLFWAMLWLASLVVIAVGLFTLWHARVHVQAHWPASRRLYRLLPGAG